MTKLVQPNVLQTYQSGEVYAANELVLYNGVAAFANIALSQGTAGTAGNFTTIGVSTFSDSAFRVQDNSDATKQLAFEVSGITTGITRTWTIPNVDINFGNLSFVATTNSNVLTGTRTQIVGGSSNTVSGTDSVAVGATSTALAGVGQVALGTNQVDSTFTTPGAVIRGGVSTVTTHIRPKIVDTVFNSATYTASPVMAELTTAQYGGSGASNTRLFAISPKTTNTGQMAVHDIKVCFCGSGSFIATIESAYIRYRVIVIYEGYNAGAGGPLLSIRSATAVETVLDAGVTASVAFTLNGKNLVMTPSLTDNSYAGPKCVAFVTSYYDTLT